MRVRANLAAVATFCWLPSGAPTASEDLASLFYRFHLMEYCGLSSDAAARGFQAAVDDMIERENLSRAAIEAAAAAGRARADAALRPAGESGFRARCAVEGAEAAARFTHPQ